MIIPAEVIYAGAYAALVAQCGEPRTPEEQALFARAACDAAEHGGHLAACVRAAVETWEALREPLLRV